LNRFILPKEPEGYKGAVSKTVGSQQATFGSLGYELLPNPAVYEIKRRRCAAPGPALIAPGSALGGPPGAPRRTSRTFPQIEDDIAGN